MEAAILTTPQGIQIECTDTIEVWRVTTINKKERGTIRWLDTVQTGDVVCDVGANIGLYALLAALRGAAVYAVEPHVANAARLLRNVGLNAAALARTKGSVRVLTVALHETPGFLPFHYIDHAPGSSGSQLGHMISEAGNAFQPVGTELKCAMTLDTLVASGIVAAPTMVKIDVDGNEPAILRGMRKTLHAGSVRSLQVETHPKTDAEILALMGEAGYRLAERHHTANGYAAIARGSDPLQVPHNAVFTREEIPR